MLHEPIRTRSNAHVAQHACGIIGTQVGTFDANTGQLLGLLAGYWWIRAGKGEWLIPQDTNLTRHADVTETVRGRDWVLVESLALMPSDISHRHRLA